MYLRTGSGLIPRVGSCFELFVADAFVSLVGSEERALIKLLRDTHSKHSLVLPFSLATEMVVFVLMKGLELGLIPVRRHNIVLACVLVQGIVLVGVLNEALV